MGTFTSTGEQRRELVDKAVAAWKESCLLADGSLLFPDAEVWTLEAVEEMYRRYNEKPLLGAGTFEEKLQEQLKGADTSVIRFAAEAMLVYWLFSAWQVHPNTKREQIVKILSWGSDGEDVGDRVKDRVAWRALDGGIGNPGGGYLFNRWRELDFIVDWVRDWKRLDDEKRRRLIDDPVGFRKWLDQRATAEGRQFRHILLNLLWPEAYERIASGRHKREIVAAFSDLIDSELQDDDDRLAAIRTRLRDLVPNAKPDGDRDWMPSDDGSVPDDEFDFYRPPVNRAWLAGKEDSLPALLFKKAVVLYGPPGTGKTYEANQLAAAVIRRRALEDWGASAYFERLEEVESAAKENIHRIQLHPAYSYEDFIGGLRMTAERRCGLSAGPPCSPLQRDREGEGRASARADPRRDQPGRSEPPVR